MSCPSDEDLLAYAQGALAGGDTTAIEAHVADCDACRMVLAGAMHELGATAPEPDVGETLPPGEPGPGDHVGRYTLVESLGAGAIGVVYAARDPESGAVVAIKVLRRPSEPGDDRVGARFQREASILRELDDAHIVRYLDHGYTGDRQLYLAMELLDGESLSSRLARGPLSLAECLDLARGVASGLAAAHARGVVHRDVKPPNLFLQGGDVARVKILDFGIARLDEQERGLTRSGDLVGTPLYMSPEQVRGERLVGPAADVWSLGCVLFQCLAGRIPFAAGHMTSVMANILYAPAPRLRALVPDAPARLDELLERMLAKDPRQRPATGAEVLKELQLVGSGGSRPPTTALPEPLSASEQRLHTAVILAAAPAGLSEIVRPFGGRLETLLDGTGVITFAARELPAVRARKAARCAVALRHAVPATRITVASWRGPAATGWPVGESFDSALGRLPDEQAAITIDELTACLLGTSWEVCDGELRGPREPAREAGAFVGRERELLTLQYVADACFQEPAARAALVTGAPGMGKTRLAAELVRRLTGVRVWCAAGDPAGARAPLAVATELARSGGAGGPLEGVTVPAPRAERAALVERMRQQWLDLLGAACDEGPLVLLVDDVQWADRDSMRLIEGGLRRHADRPVLAVGLVQTEIVDAPAALWQSVRPTRIALGELPRRAAERIAAAAIRSGLSEREDAALVGRIVERAGGNPLFIEEMARFAGEGGEGFPETVLGIAEARLGRLSRDARRALRAGSVFGATFWAGGVAALLGGAPAADVDGWLAQATARGLSAPRAAGRFPGEHAFRHGTLHAAAYATLTDEDRARGHRLAGLWLVERGDLDAAMAHVAPAGQTPPEPGPGLFAQGRHALVRDWVLSIPEEVRDADPGLCLWLGEATQPLDAAAARVAFERAHTLFAEDEAGRLLAASGVVECLLVEGTERPSLLRWLAELERPGVAAPARVAARAAAAAERARARLAEVS